MSEKYEKVNHPKHYNAHPSGVECIDIIEHFNLNIGSAIKHANLEGGTVLISGLDTGEPVGVATLLFDGTALHWVDSRTEPSMFLDEIIAQCAGVVAIERPKGFYPSRGMLAKGSKGLAAICEGLLHACWVGGELKGLARAAGKRVYEVGAPEARRSIGVLIGGRGESRDETVDKQIATKIYQLVRGWPKRGTDGDHVNNRATRDAAVAAIYALQFARQEG